MQLSTQRRGTHETDSRLPWGQEGLDDCSPPHFPPRRPLPSRAPSRPEDLPAGPPPGPLVLSDTTKNCISSRRHTPWGTQDVRRTTVRPGTTHECGGRTPAGVTLPETLAEKFCVSFRGKKGPGVASGPGPSVLCLRSCQVSTALQDPWTRRRWSLLRPSLDSWSEPTLLGTRVRHLRSSTDLTDPVRTRLDRSVPLPHSRLDPHGSTFLRPYPLWVPGDRRGT